MITHALGRKHLTFNM